MGARFDSWVPRQRPSILSSVMLADGLRLSSASAHACISVMKCFEAKTETLRVSAAYQ